MSERKYLPDDDAKQLCLLDPALGIIAIQHTKQFQTLMSNAQEALNDLLLEVINQGTRDE